MRNQSCSCRSGPAVLRLALPPGTAPELAVLLVQTAVREHYLRRALDMPPKHTPETYGAACLEIARPYAERAAAAWHTLTEGR